MYINNKLYLNIDCGYNQRFDITKLTYSAKIPVKETEFVAS